MKPKGFLILALLLLLAACGPSEETIQATVESRIEIAVIQTIAAIPTQTPYPTLTPFPIPTVNPIPESLRVQLSTFLQAANAVTGATSQGVSYLDLRRLVNEARGAYDFAVAVWPDSISKEAQVDFEKAFEGWDLTLLLWNAKIEKYDEPVEPDINRYQDFVRYSDMLIRDTHPDDFIVREYRGKEYVPFDNVEVLMSIAGIHFKDGQEKALSLLE